MFVTVENYIKKLLDQYGFNQILHDNDLTKAEVLQILEDHGYLNFDNYREGECE